MDKKSKLRLTFAILATLFVVFTIGNYFSLEYSKKKILAEADLIATRDMDKLLLTTDVLLSECEASAYNFRALLGTEMMKSESLYKILYDFLKTNPKLMGSTVAVEPEYAAKNPDLIPALFLYGNEEKGYRYLRLDSIYEYYKGDWYANTKATMKPNWGNPMRASDGTLISPFCLPLTDSNGDFIGVVTANVALDGLTEMMKTAAPYPDALVTLMDKDLNFIAHPDPEFVLKKSLDSLYKDSSIAVNESIYVDILNSVRGSSSYGKGDNRRLVYYAPVEKSKWTIAIDCPYQDIYEQVDNVKMVMLLNMLFGMLVFGFVCWKLVSRIEQNEKVVAIKAAMEGELNIAASIQRGMLPKLYPPFPDVKNLDVYGMQVPAKEVGGDLFDYFIRDDKFFFCIGDVSGKGVPASLFMSVLRALFRNVTLHVDDPAVIAKALNQALSEGNDQNMFCTMFMGVLDIHTGHLDYCNCGHNAPVVRHITDDGQIDVHYEQVNTNIALGIIDGFEYKAQDVTMKPGEAILLYTDGVTEAESNHMTYYGEQRLLDALSKARNRNVRSAKEFIEAIYADVEDFADSNYQSDDITMVVVEFKGPDQSA